MQIVIDISEKQYEIIKKLVKNQNAVCPEADSAEKIILKGTPLPKGHGRLKDFDKIEWYGCDLEGRGCIEAKGDCSVCSHANCYANQVRELPTIIEADKGSENK